MSEIRKEVQAFAEIMEYRLAINDDKGHWGFETWDYLIQRLLEEVSELMEAKNQGGDVCNEAADVANFAMMIADNFGDLKEG